MSGKSETRPMPCNQCKRIIQIPLILIQKLGASEVFCSRKCEQLFITAEGLREQKEQLDRWLRSQS